MFGPVRLVGRFLFSAVLVPVFRLLIAIRRGLHQLYLPAKSKILFLFSNRFAIHFAIVIISFFSVFTNIRPLEVRAEEYGQESIIYAVLGQDSPDIISEVTAGETPLTPEISSYRGEVALTTPIAKDPSLEVLSNEEESGGALAPHTTEEKPAAVPARSTIETYTVAEGDTISTIAQKFGLSITTILWANNLSVRSMIHPGDRLTILPVDGVVHKVKNGETLSKIAKLYGADADKIQTSNNLASANSLSIGQELLIPGGERQAPAPTRRVASVGSIFTPEQAPKGSTSRNAVGMIWPTDKSKVNTYYGQYYIYGRHWGLDIDCDSANTNYAAADGIVLRAGWAGGYGNLVEIDHGNGVVTRYGHNAKLYVKAGQSVNQGDPVGLCGTTGRSTGNHLHFEIRINGKTVNPLDYVSP